MEHDVDTVEPAIPRRIGHGEVGEHDRDVEVDLRRCVGDADHLDVAEGTQRGDRLDAEVAGDTGDEHTSGQRSVPLRRATVLKRFNLRKVGLENH